MCTVRGCRPAAPLNAPAPSFRQSPAMATRPALVLPPRAAPLEAQQPARHCPPGARSPTPLDTSAVSPRPCAPALPRSSRRACLCPGHDTPRGPLLKAPEQSQGTGPRRRPRHVPVSTRRRVHVAAQSQPPVHARIGTHSQGAVASAVSRCSCAATRCIVCPQPAPCFPTQPAEKTTPQPSPRGAQPSTQPHPALLAGCAAAVRSATFVLSRPPQHCPATGVAGLASSSAANRDHRVPGDDPPCASTLQAPAASPD